MSGGRKVSMLADTAPDQQMIARRRRCLGPAAWVLLPKSFAPVKGMERDAAHVNSSHGGAALPVGI